MDKKYEKSLHVVGRLGLLIGISFMLGIPAIICAIFDVWPSSVGQVLTVGGSLLLVFLPTALAEVVSYTPVLGSSAYITFLTGNVLNLKLPCVINSHSLTGTTQGTDEGDTIASISVAASTITTTIIIILGVLLLVPLEPILTSPVVSTAAGYLLPSLFGGAEVLRAAKRLTDSPLARRSLEHLEAVYADLQRLGVGKYVSFDLGTVKSLAYYSGIVFTGLAEGVGAPVLSGGRYDGLCAQFGKNLAAVGFAVGMNRALRAVRAKEGKGC